MRTQFLRYFWVVTLLFLAGAAYLSARLASVVLARRLWVSEVVAAPAASQRDEPAAGERLTDFQAIQSRNLFNAHPKPVEEAPAPPPTASAPAAPVVPVVPLNITLMGTALVEGGRSFALLTSGAELKLVREGDEVEPGAVLSRVLVDRIFVTQAGREQEFLLNRPEDATAAVPARTSRYARPQPTPEPAAGGETVRQVDESSWLIDKREVDQASANMSQLMTQIRVVPNFTDGQPDGFKVFAIRPGSLFSKIGLQNGDVLKRVNGIDLQGPEQAFEAYQGLKDQTSLQIDLVRRNENRTFSYEIR